MIKGLCSPDAETSASCFHDNITHRLLYTGENTGVRFSEENYGTNLQNKRRMKSYMASVKLTGAVK